MQFYRESSCQHQDSYCEEPIKEPSSDEIEKQKVLLLGPTEEEFAANAGSKEKKANFAITC